MPACRSPADYAAAAARLIQCISRSAACARACTMLVFDRQTADEQQLGMTIHRNGVGLNKVDARSHAVQQLRAHLLDGRRQYARGLCEDLAVRYATQIVSSATHEELAGIFSHEEANGDSESGDSEFSPARRASAAKHGRARIRKRGCRACAQTEPRILGAHRVNARGELELRVRRSGVSAWKTYTAVVNDDSMLVQLGQYLSTHNFVD